jgi:hypothetical protein
MYRRDGQAAFQRDKNKVKLGRPPKRENTTTYIATQQGWAYLSTIKDLFDEFIVAYQVGQENSFGVVLNTFK